MCGITGFFSNQPIEPEHLIKMNQRLRHRGPDGEGFCWFNQEMKISQASPDTPHACMNKNLPWSPRDFVLPIEFKPTGGLGHRRLAIIDLEAGGHQPLCSPDKRFWITYNGEIYNYPELKEELLSAGYKFYSKSDSEVVLNSYIHWGKECLQKFNGMWAFAIFDSTEKKIFAARDRFGVKPLYYYHQNNNFIFASEQKSILENPLVIRELNEHALFDFFVFGEIEYQEEGFFKKILELKPAHYLEYFIEKNEIRTSQYYSLPYNQEKQEWDRKSFLDAAEEIEFLLNDAIRIRLRADVEVGSCLSGGIDSSSIVALMRKNLAPGKPLHVFSAVFPGENIDESQYATEMAQFINAHHHTVNPKPSDLTRDLDELSLCQDIPLWSTSTYAQFRVMKMTRQQGLKVVLDGQGGDELFSGYKTHLSFFWKELRTKALFTEMHAYGDFFRAMIFHFKQQARFDYVFRLPGFLTSAMHKFYFKDLLFLNPDFYHRNAVRFQTRANPRFSSLNQRLSYEMQNTSLKGYLKCEDRCAMWHGVEARTPFADDHRLIEKVFSLPSSLKIKSGVEKILLRQAMENYLPEKIRNRRDKLGYATPNHQWLKSLYPNTEEMFNNELEEYLDINKIKEFFPKMLAKEKQDSGRLFKYLSFVSWHKAFFK